MIYHSLPTQREITRLDSDNEHFLKEIEEHPFERADVIAKMEAAIKEREIAKFEAQQAASQRGKASSVSASLPKQIHVNTYQHMHSACTRSII